MKPKPKTNPVIIKRGPWTWRLRPELEEKLESIEQAILSPQGRANLRAVKETGGRRTIWTLPLSPAGVQKAFIKHYSRPRFFKQLKHLVRNSRTRQEWEMGLKFEALGLPVAKHLALAERRIAGLLQEDYLVQENLEGYQNFDAWFEENLPSVISGPAVKERRTFIERFADLIRNMHDQGVLQRDFKPDSIMVGPGRELKFVDLERALISSRPGGLSLSRRIENLAKIDQTFGFIGSMTDRLRFLRRYFQGSKVSRDQLRKIAVEIGRRAELNFRRRGREVRVWAHTSNTSYEQYSYRGFRVSQFISLHRKFMASVIHDLTRAACEDLVCSWEPEHPGVTIRLRGIWCDARTALAHSPYLYYRRVPFIPARAALYPGRGNFGFLLLEIPQQALLLTWKQAAKEAALRDDSVTFASELGRALRILHRMGITWNKYTHDTMLCDPAHQDFLLRFYVSRLDHLLLDHSPSEKHARKILTTIEDLLELSPSARRALENSYDHCRLRWFRALDRW